MIEDEKRGNFQRELAVVLVSSLTVIGIVAGLYFLLRITPQDRFDSCLALADNSGLLADRKQEVALVCLQAAMGESRKQPSMKHNILKID